MERKTWAMKGNGSPTYLLCFLVEQLLDISLTSGTIQAEHCILRVASACPTRSSNTATGETGQLFSSVEFLRCWILRCRRLMILLHLL